MKSILNKIKRYLGYDDIKNRQIDILMLLSQLKIEKIKKTQLIDNLRDTEFKVFSQWGEDGIIQYLISKIDVPRKIFIEFGVGNYTEANTRFLLMNNHWSGLVIDSSQPGIDYIKKDDIYWKYDLNAVCEHITKDNINQILKDNVKESDIGLLSIDIDGNDYWMWKEINVVKPRIVICEYNSIFGCERFVTVPYDKNFNRTKKHFSNLYFGASLPALCLLAEEKGYDFVGCNLAGNDAFFVRKDLSNPFRLCDYAKDYVSKHRKTRDINDNLKYKYVDKNEILKEIHDMEIFDIKSKRIVLIKDLFK